VGKYIYDRNGKNAVTSTGKASSFSSTFGKGGSYSSGNKVTAPAKVSAPAPAKVTTTASKSSGSNKPVTKTQAEIDAAFRGQTVITATKVPVTQVSQTPSNWAEPFLNKTTSLPVSSLATPTQVSQTPSNWAEPFLNKTTSLPVSSLATPTQVKPMVGMVDGMYVDASKGTANVLPMTDADKRFAGISSPIAIQASILSPSQAKEQQQERDNKAWTDAFAKTPGTKEYNLTHPAMVTQNAQIYDTDRMSETYGKLIANPIAGQVTERYNLGGGQLVDLNPKTGNITRVMSGKGGILEIKSGASLSIGERGKLVAPIMKAGNMRSFLGGASGLGVDKVLSNVTEETGSSSNSQILFSQSPFTGNKFDYGGGTETRTLLPDDLKKAMAFNFSATGLTSKQTLGQLSSGTMGGRSYGVSGGRITANPLKVFKFREKGLGI
jgi:hypothetical protein